tara:strand:+ start:851 stop:1486 length:636 start_codon:yes stop_codon:yes gene_type:complete
MKNVIGIGAGNHCHQLIEIINQQNEYYIYNFFEIDEKKLGKDIQNIKIIKEDLLILDEHLIKDFFLGFAGNHSNYKLREKIYLKFVNHGLNPIRIIDQNAIISNSAKLSNGITILKSVIINTNVIIGENTLINNGAIIEHDVQIGNHTNISPGVKIAGNVRIGNNVFIGLNSTIIENITIEDNAIVGAGSVVIKDVYKNTKVAGNPAKEIN